MKCIFCQKGPDQGITLFRVNAKGQPGVWACPKHVDQTDAFLDPELLEIVNTLSPKPGDQP